MPSLLYPNHRYLGPGNPIDNGTPVDNADRIAQVHDIEYNSARTKEDIFESDTRAIQSFKSDFLAKPNLPSLVGLVGLGVKNTVEQSLLNTTIYPNNLPGRMPFPKRGTAGFYKATSFINKRNAARKLKGVGGPSGTKRGAPTDGEGDDSNKALKESDAQAAGKAAGTTVQDSPSYSPDSRHGEMDPESGAAALSAPDMDEPMQLDAAYADGSGGIGLRSGAGGMRGTAILPTGLRDPCGHYTRTYTKQYKLRLFNSSIEARSISTHITAGNQIRYPYHDLPVDYVGFYFSPDELAELSHYTQVNITDCEVSVSNKTAVLFFETAASTSTIGNNNVGVYLAQIDPAVTSCRTGMSNNDLQHDMQHIFWGTHFNALNLGTAWSAADLNKLSAQFVVHNYDNRFEYYSENITDQASNTVGRKHGYIPHAFPIQDFIVQRRNSSMEEGQFLSWKYKPQHGLIFHKFDQMVNGSNLGRSAFTLENQNQPNHPGVNSALFQGGSASHSVYQTLDTPTPIMCHDVPVAHDKRDWFRMPIDNKNMSGHSGAPVPGCILGIESLYSQKSANTAPELVRCYVDIIVDVACKVKIRQGVDYIRAYELNGNWERPHPATTYRTTRLLTKTPGQVHGEIDLMMPDERTSTYSSAGYTITTDSHRISSNPQRADTTYTSLMRASDKDKAKERHGKLLAKIVQDRDKKRKAKVDELNKLKDHTYTESDLNLL